MYKLTSIQRPIWSGSYLLLFVALAMRVVPGGGNWSYIVLAACALCGRVDAILALCLSWFFTMINPGLTATSDIGGTGRYFVITAAVLSAFFRGGLLKFPRDHKSLLPITYIILIFVIVHSLLVSPHPDVSILKALSWGLTMTALLALWLGLSADQYEYATRLLFSLLTLLLVVSIPLLVFPAGYLVNGSGFQGALNHPQAFGAAMALLGAWSAARALAQPIPQWRMIALSVSALVFVFLSEARTAGLAMISGVGVALSLLPIATGRKVAQLAPGVGHGRVRLVVLAGLLTAPLAASVLLSSMTQFWTKSGKVESTDLIGSYQNSRGFLIDAMLGNIRDYPLQGIGFGIASDPYGMIVDRDPTLGLPVGALIEKGVAPLAVLEEIGIFGALLTAAWILRLIRQGAVGGLAPAAVLLTALFLNLGENTFFSAGGFGLLPMIMFAWIYSSGGPANPARA